MLFQFRLKNTGPFQFRYIVYSHKKVRKYSELNGKILLKFISFCALI